VAHRLIVNNADVGEILAAASLDADIEAEAERRISALVHVASRAEKEDAAAAAAAAAEEEAASAQRARKRGREYEEEEERKTAGGERGGEAENVVLHNQDAMMHRYLVQMMAQVCVRVCVY
jgi:hypothetical protein